MKTIGLIGGMSWESSLGYYQVINEKVKERLGGLHSAKSLMFSFDFAEIELLQHEGRWKEATQMMQKDMQTQERTVITSLPFMPQQKKMQKKLPGVHRVLLRWRTIYMWSRSLNWRSKKIPTS